MNVNSTSMQPTGLNGIFYHWYQREPVLVSLTLAAMAFIPLFFALTIIDERPTNGISIWHKPLKFHIAIAMFTGTLAWYCAWIDRSVMTRWWYRVFSYTIIFCVVVELCWLSGAAMIGELSHFNRTHPILSPMYSLMGVVAVLLTSANVFIATLIMTNKKTPLTPYFRNAVVAGLIISFLFTVAIAGELASMDSHWIGGTQSDEKGFPLFGWSRDGGDLRIAHFFSLHAMQFVPLAALVKLPRTWSLHPHKVTIALSLLYSAFILYVYFQAKLGIPFLAWLTPG